MSQMIIDIQESQYGIHRTNVCRQKHIKPVYKLLEEMWVEKGTREDWLLLHALHYKMASEPVGAKYWRLRFRGETIGVLVLGMSRPLLKERHAVFPLLCPGVDTQVSNIHRYAHINDHFRVVGRFVVDTMYRSAGVAYRFLNLAARQTGFRYIELQSSMSKYNSFAQRGGFSMVKPIKSLHYAKGLTFMRRWFEAHPGDLEAVMEEFETFNPALQARVQAECKAWYIGTSPLEKTGSRRFYAGHAMEGWDMRRTINKIQGLCFTTPLYGFYRNPDCAGVDDPKGSLTVGHIPDILPLLAFDLQPTDKPLRVDNLSDVPGWHNLKILIAENNWREPTLGPENKTPEENNAASKKNHKVNKPKTVKQREIHDEHKNNRQFDEHKLA